MTSSKILVAILLLPVGITGCVNIDLGPLLPGGTPFVVSGTAELIEKNGECLVWRGENGVTYHLFQSPFVLNALFDAVTTPGTTSRLVLSVREDLEVACRVGPTVEVESILEVVKE